ncbi:helix-turn-helix transcriptional regulator [Alphaproteobacteria bacterium KMM 3653]|uniref:Helix-turn-helix transcriptional regulator n=1 Tax=Harenicola maris TaxID=2841044 RepID=A0AAP2G8H8_9RHOB|nr:helix-turn-helix transcriptional regulator [Harenicola maris]
MYRATVKDRTQLVPFPEANDLQTRIARAFSLVTDWNAALNGHYNIQEVIDVASRQFESLNVSLFRLRAGRAWPIASACRQLDGLKPRVSSGAIASYVQNNHAEALDPGSIWRLTELREEAGFAGSPAHKEYADRPDIVEVSTIVLEASDGAIDCLEVTFDRPPNRHPDLPSSIVTQALADSWAARSPGLISRAIRSYGRARGRTGVANDNVDILGPHNPFGLSRAEQRVCQMIADGQKAKEIADALGVSLATVRSHMHKIYAKTGTSGQVELVVLVAEAKGGAE